MASFNFQKLRELSPKNKGLILLAVILVPTSVVFAILLGMNVEQPELPARLLFIGNSLTYHNEGVDFHIEQICNCVSPPRIIETDTVYRSAAPLAELHPASAYKIAMGNYDYIIVQGTPEFGFESFKTNARLILEAINDTDSQPVLFMAWKHLGKPPWAGSCSWNETFELLSMEVIAQAHYDLAEEFDALVAPVGLAFERVNETCPGFQLYADVEHPSMNGTYLATLVIYSTIFGESPVEFSYRPTSPPLPEYCLNVTEEDASFLQEIAWETVQENLPPILKSILLLRRHCTVLMCLIVLTKEQVMLIGQTS
ncbi:MAG: hypothetical protein ACFFAL_11130 [Promethearchaeota archaeon]